MIYCYAKKINEIKKQYNSFVARDYMPENVWNELLDSYKNIFIENFKKTNQELEKTISKRKEEIESLKKRLDEITKDEDQNKNEVKKQEITEALKAIQIEANELQEKPEAEADKLIKNMSEKDLLLQLKMHFSERFDKNNIDKCEKKLQDSLNKAKQYLGDYIKNKKKENPRYKFTDVFNYLNLYVNIFSQEIADKFYEKYEIYDYEAHQDITKQQ